MTRRTTAADVVVDGLRRAGTPRVIGVARERADLPILDAARAAGLPVVLAAGETGACAIAAVTGDLVDAPGAVVIGEKATVSAATLGMLGGAPVILITSSHPSAMPGCKETLRMESESAAHRIAHANLRETLQPQETGVTMTAGGAGRVGIIAARRERVIDAQIEPAADDLGLG